MMTWFDRLFPALMVLLPALIVRGVAVHKAAQADAAAKARRLYGLTALALLLHGVAMVLFETLQEGRSVGRSSWVMGFSMFVFFHLWFWFAAPALAARNPGWRNVHGSKPQRSAALTPRHEDPSLALPLSAWVVGWWLFAAAVATTIWSVLQGAHPALLVGLIWWPGFAWGARAVRVEPEPRVPAARLSWQPPIVACAASGPGASTGSGSWAWWGSAW